MRLSMTKAAQDDIEPVTLSEARHPERSEGSHLGRDPSPTAQDDIEPVTLSEAKGRILVEILRLRLRMTKAAQYDIESVTLSAARHPERSEGSHLGRDPSPTAQDDQCGSG